MFGKHFESMYTGSMVGSGAVNFAVWGYIISHQKPPTFDVELNPTILSTIIGESESDIIETIRKFCEPDEKSRTKTEEGRKLLKLGEYLYHVVNGEQYHRMRTNDERREYFRVYRKNRRLAQKSGEHCEQELNGDDKDEEAIKILAFLNEKTGRQFRNSGASLKPIMARLAESEVTVEGVLKMVERQVKLWKGDGKMEEYLRPETLFGKEKFNAYYAARELPVGKNAGSGSSSGKPNPRNFGIAVGPTDYATAKPRLQRQLEAEEAERVAKQVAERKDNPSQTGAGAA